MEERLQRIEESLARLTELVESRQAWQHKFTEFIDEISPVARSAMDTATHQLAGLEQGGYFALAGDLRLALQRVAHSYDPGSLPDLAEVFGDVTYILRLLTQPRILAVLQDVAEEFSRAGSEPVEMLGAAKRIETEKDIQRGIAFSLDLFGTLGRSVARSPRLKTGRKPPSAGSPRPGVKRTKPAVVPTVADDFPFVTEHEWNRDWANETAERLGVGPLSDQKWKIVEFSRGDYLETKKSPNLRRITKALDISTRDVYALFPAAPGPTISRLAGIPKPAGCL